MKKHKSIWLLLLTGLAACTPKEAETPPKLYSMAQFMDIVQINGGSFSPDETKLLISSKETGIFNAVEIDLKTGQQTAMTNSTDNAISAYGYFPKDNRILYGSDKGGNEITHLYVLSGGDVIDLIQDSTAKAQFYGWSYNQKLMYYASNSRDKRFFDLHTVQIDGTSEDKVYPSTVVYKNEKD